MEGCFFYCAMCCTTHINEAGDPGGETVQIKKEGVEEWDGYSLSEKYVFVFRVWGQLAFRGRRREDCRDGDQV